MKVFISYSSRDRWVARRISSDLDERGIETFMDEKDIETGDSIDDAIQDHLTECDELLMLLSPAALKSHWVMLEIGGAKVLQKRLIPILLHVGANELPSPLSKGLARDLNDIEKYYEEVEARGGADGEVDVEGLPALSGEDSLKGEQPQRDFKIGDFVRIPEKSQDLLTNALSPGWVSSMDQHVGKVGQVVSVDTDRTVQVDTAGRWWWSMDWLEPANPPATQ